ncbi:MAG: matrixin family metalloprotease, partial [Candidatus Eisenbacteria bacterium]
LAVAALAIAPVRATVRSPSKATDLLVELIHELPAHSCAESSGSRYCAEDRWEATATDPDTGPEGDPITLTWSFVPDGTVIDGIGEGDFFAAFDSAWGSAAWMTKIRNAFQRWDDVTGVRFIEVSDDGAPFPQSPGILGVRGDVRLAGAPIDGPGNIFALAFYPDVGDIVLDTDDTDFYRIPAGNFANLKNTVARGLGHAFGLGRSFPVDCTKLMEGFSCGGLFIGPQDDDIRGAQRLYGDIRENNDTGGSPSDLGSVIGTANVDTVSIDHETDADWYRFTTATGAGAPAEEESVAIRVEPVGSCYFIGCEPETASWVWTCTDSILDLDLFLFDSTGTLLLDSACSAGIGAADSISYFPLPYHGDYLVRVLGRAGGGDDVQRYTMTIRTTVATGIASRETPVPVLASPGLVVMPNPFNPSTTIRCVLPGPGRAVVAVYDTAGRRVALLADAYREAGEFTLLWDGTTSAGREAGSGVYFARLEARAGTAMRKIVLLQ